MEHSQNIYGLFVVYRYMCVDVIIINSFVVLIQTCLRSYSALHRFSYVFINYFDLLKWRSMLHRLIILSLRVYFFPSDKASLSCHRFFSIIYIDKPRWLIILCRVN